ncbi:hypothetical protein [Pseudoalteromonas maricaloris]
MLFWQYHYYPPVRRLCQSLIKKNREPESRTEYSGVEGLAQQQQDQNYLMRKELQDKCDDAKVNLAIAKSDKATKAIKKHQREIKDYCI